MKKTTKWDLIEDMARNSGFPQMSCKMVVEVFQEVMVEFMADDSFEERKLELRNFGTFYTRIRKPRPARNPHTGEVVPLPRRKVLLFRLSADIKFQMNASPEEAA